MQQLKAYILSFLTCFYSSGTGIGGLVGSSQDDIEPTLVKSVKNVKDVVSTMDRVLVLDSYGDVSKICNSGIPTRVS